MLNVLVQSANKMGIAMKNEATYLLKPTEKVSTAVAPETRVREVLGTNPGRGIMCL
jgi:hypothetical protein